MTDLSLLLALQGGAQQALHQKYFAFLESPCAEDRLEGIRRVDADALQEAVPRLVPLLADDAPFAFSWGERVLVGEVRFAALDTVEKLFRLGGRRLDFGAVLVRRAMPDTEIRTRLAQARHPAPEVRAAESRVDVFLDQRVRPPQAHRDLLRSYRLLQELGEVDYRLEDVDPVLFLTPLQREVMDSQTVRPRPRPHLAVRLGPPSRLLLGYLHREEGTWKIDFADNHLGREAADDVREILTGLDRAGVPRVVCDPMGEARRNPDGSLVLAGTTPLDTPHPGEILASVRAFLQGRYQAELAP